MDEREPSWPRQLGVGLAVLLVIGALIGVIVAVIAVKAAVYLGVGDKAGTSSPGPVLPTTGSITQHPTTPPPTTSGPSTSQRPPARHLIHLTVSPTTAGTFERVNLTGTYEGHDGAELQIQRSVGDGGWADFPASTHVSGGQFATYIQTGMVGVNHFRMLDKATGTTSNAATVTIG